MRPSTQWMLAITVGALFMSAGAADSQISGVLSSPVLGYFFSHSDKTIRPLQGIAGNAVVGGPVELGFPVGQALMLDGRHLLVSSDANSNLLHVSIGSSPASVALPLPAWPSKAAVSARGGAAAFYYEGRGAYVVTGLPDAPQVRSVSLDREGLITQLAVSTDGTLLVYVVRDENGESIYSATPTAGRFLAAARTVGGLALTADGSLIVADREADEIFAIRGIRGAPSRQFMADARDGVSSPAAVSVSADNAIYVANARSVLAFDASGRLKRLRACACAPSGVYRINDSLFRLTDRADQTIYLLNAAADDQIFFVPPPLADSRHR